MADSNGIPYDTPRVLPWLDQNWPYVGTAIACILFALLPLLAVTWSRPPLIVFLLLVAYQIHQVEEHYRDRFRRYVNEVVAGGVDALTARATMWINVGGIWAVYLATVLLTGLVDPGFGFVAVYATLVNAGAHTVGAAITKSYNPGLWTALVLLFPLAGIGLSIVGEANGLGVLGHALGIAVAGILHAAVGVSVKRRQAALR